MYARPFTLIGVDKYGGFGPLVMLNEGRGGERGDMWSKVEYFLHENYKDFVGEITPTTSLVVSGTRHKRKRIPIYFIDQSLCRTKIEFCNGGMDYNFQS